MSCGKISVIVPIYNMELYLERCIESIISQTYKNLEIILVDDGSIDKSFDICKKYERDIRVKVIKKENEGLSAARNAGLDICTGDFIYFIDSDDWIELDTLAYALDMMLSNNSDISIFGFFESTNNIDRIVKKGFLDNNIIVLSNEEALEYLIGDEYIKSHVWNKLYKRKIFKEIRFPNKKNYEDICIMHELFFQSNSICLSFQPKYHYFIREDSISRNYTYTNILDYIDSHLLRYKFLKDNNIEVLLDVQISKLVEVLLSYYPKKVLWIDKRIEKKIYCKNMHRKIKSIVALSNKKQFQKNSEKKYKFMFTIFLFNKLLYKLIYRFSISFIDKIKKSKYKYKLKIFFHKDKDFVKKIEKMKNINDKIFLFGLPEYENLGDIAMAYSQIQYLNKKFPNRTIVHVTEKNLIKYYKKISSICLPKDVILLQGGGNFGDVYLDQEYLRQIIFKNFNNKVVTFPLTFFMKDFSNAENIQKYLSPYSKHDMYISFREQRSFNLVRNFFNDRCILTPDIAMRIEIPSNMLSDRKDNVALCMRMDIEKNIDFSDINMVKSILLSRFNFIDIFDTCINCNVNYCDYENQLLECWNFISRHKLVVTDRLHAMIFCYLTKTPCLVFGNSNNKILGVYEWIKSCNFIKYCNDLAEFSCNFEKILNISNDFLDGIVIDESQFEELYKSIV